MTERNLQVLISRLGDAEQQKTMDEWKEADRKLGRNKKTAATDGDGGEQVQMALEEKTGREAIVQ